MGKPTELDYDDTDGVDSERGFTAKPIPAKIEAHLVRLGAKPKARLKTLQIEEVDTHRNLTCRHYDVCLDAAVAGNWMSFECTGCVHFTGGVDCSGGAPDDTHLHRREAWPSA